MTKALICGASITGLTAAWWLKRSGWDVELVERAPAPRDGGYMTDFFGPGHEVARRMDLLSHLNDVRDLVLRLARLPGACLILRQSVIPGVEDLVQRSDGLTFESGSGASVAA